MLNAFKKRKAKQKAKKQEKARMEMRGKHKAVEYSREGLQEALDKMQELEDQRNQTLENMDQLGLGTYSDKKEPKGPSLDR